MNDQTNRHTHHEFHDDYSSRNDNSSITSKFFAPFVVLVLLLGVFFTVQQIQKQQETRSRAQLTQGVRLYMQPETGSTTIAPGSAAFYVTVLMDTRTVQNITAAELHIKSSDPSKLAVQEIQIGSALPQKLPPSAGNFGTVTGGIANLIVGSGCPGSTTAQCTENGQLAIMGQPKSGNALQLARVKVQPGASATGTVNLLFDQTCALNSVCTGNNTQIAARDAAGNVVAPTDAQQLTFTFSTPPTNTPPAATNTPPAATNTPPAATNTPPAATNTPPAATNTPPAATNTPPAATNTPAVTGERFLRGAFSPQPDSAQPSYSMTVISRDGTNAKFRVILNLPSTIASVQSVKVKRTSNNTDVATLTATQIPGTGIWRVVDQTVNFSTSFTANEMRSGGYKIEANIIGLSTFTYTAPLTVLVRANGDLDGNNVLNVSDFNEVVSDLGKPRGNYFSDIITVSTDQFTDLTNGADYNKVIQAFSAAQ